MDAVTATYYDEEEKVWYGPCRKDFYGPDMTLGEVALSVLSKIPNKVVQITDSTGEKLTAEQLIRNSKLVAKNLLECGLKVGDIVGIVATNTTHLSSVMLGAFLCGTPTNALYPTFDKESIKVIFAQTLPKIVFCVTSNYETTRAACADLKLNCEIVVLNGNISGARNISELFGSCGVNLDKMKFPCLNMKGEDTAAILCSSGTTGPPKGSLCSHQALLNRELYLSIQPDSVLFSFSTLYWASGLWTFISALRNGVTRIVTDQPFSPEYFLQLIETQRITHMITAPHPIAQVIQTAGGRTSARLSHVHAILCAGSKVPQVISIKMNQILGNRPRPGLCAAYGMSELSGFLSVNDFGPGKRVEGTEGKLMPNTAVRIVDSNGVLLGPNEHGIIHIKSPYRWSGYYHNAEATQKTYPDGWLITGDVGFMNEAGFLHFCSRENDIFKSNNVQICPEQIEGVILQMPGVLEAIVFGIPDLVAGNLVACAIVRADSEIGKSLSDADVLRQVARNMSNVYHINGGVHFIKTFPKTPEGKIQRRMLSNMLKK